MDDMLNEVQGSFAASVLDFYEEVIEYALYDLKSVHISLADIGYLRLSLNIRCNADLSALAQKNNALYEKDGEYQQLVFIPEGGGTK